MKAKSKKNRKNNRQMNDNPDICHFNFQSHFIFDINEGTKYLSKVKNKNSLKLSKSEIFTLYSLHDELKLIQNIQKGNRIINIDKNILDKLNSLYSETFPDEPIINFIKKIR